MTTDTTALQERIARAIRLADTGDTLPDGFAARMWDEGVTNRDKEMRLAAAVLPIIAAEVQAAKAEAWAEGCRAAEQYYRRTVVGIPGLDPIPAPVNPHEETP